MGEDHFVSVPPIPRAGSMSMSMTAPRRVLTFRASQIMRERIAKGR